MRPCDFYILSTSLNFVVMMWKMEFHDQLSKWYVLLAKGTEYILFHDSLFFFHDVHSIFVREVNYKKDKSVCEGLMS